MAYFLLHRLLLPKSYFLLPYFSSFPFLLPISPPILSLLRLPPPILPKFLHLLVESWQIFLPGRFMATNVDPLTGAFIIRPQVNLLFPSTETLVFPLFLVQATSHHRIGIMATIGDEGNPVAMELMAHAHIVAGHRCLIVPLSVMCPPLMPIADLSYDPLMCARCHSTLNPYSRIDYHSALWACPFCQQKNPFPRSYIGIDENNLPVEIFPTHSTIKHILSWNPISHSGFGLSPSSTTSQFSLLSPSSSPDSPPPPHCQGQSPPGCRAILRVCYGHLFSTGGTLGT